MNTTLKDPTTVESDNVIDISETNRQDIITVKPAEVSTKANGLPETNKKLIDITSISAEDKKFFGFFANMTRMPETADRGIKLSSKIKFELIWIVICYGFARMLLPDPFSAITVAIVLNLLMSMLLISLNNRTLTLEDFLILLIFMFIIIGLYFFCITIITMLSLLFVSISALEYVFVILYTIITVVLIVRLHK